MNLYEHEGKDFFSSHGIAVPRGVVIERNDDARAAYTALGCPEVMVKAQVLSGKRGKHGGVHHARNAHDAAQAAKDFFSSPINGQYVASVLIEERIDSIAEEYVSVTYDTQQAQPIFLHSTQGGMDIEDVPEQHIHRTVLDIRHENIDVPHSLAQLLWDCFRTSDARLVEINPLMKTIDGRFVAADAKVALDDDAFFRHEAWEKYVARSPLGRPPTERESAVAAIDAGKEYYRGTAGKYIELDGDIAVLFSGGGASIANMDALRNVGLTAANYTEYSGNPPREKVAALTKIVLSKPGLRGLWIAGGVANFTNVAETFQGIIDVLDAVKPHYPIVIRRAGPHDVEGMRAMEECAKRNTLHMQLFGKETPMSVTAQALKEMIS